VHPGLQQQARIVDHGVHQLLRGGDNVILPGPQGQLADQQYEIAGPAAGAVGQLEEQLVGDQIVGS
jgi:hypothetical protein